MLPDADHQLVERVRAGDQGALGAIHSEHYARLVRYAERITGSTENARDIVQDVFLNIWAAHKSWNVKSSIATHLYAAVRGMALRTLRHERVEERYRDSVSVETFAIGGLFGVASPDDDAQASEMLAAVYRGLNTLPVRCREAFTLYRENGLDLEEVAEVMGVSVGTVKVQIRRAAVVLRKALGPHLAE